MKDIDNLLKSLLDALKGIVFSHDQQIVKISTEKNITDKYQGVTVAIRELTSGSRMRSAPYFWATDNDPWTEQRLQEMKKGRFNIIDSY
ncbi:MAG: RusA family crossover junction endodeoxyribonuclease [Williamsia sp.]|nr:RusA family crossover junction endodeoxyribonuclease [Williamsia sp.]